MQAGIGINSPPFQLPAVSHLLFLIRALYAYAVNDDNPSRQFAEKAVELDAKNNEAKEFLKRFQPDKTQPNNTVTKETQQSVMLKNDDKQSSNKVDLFEFDD